MRIRSYSFRRCLDCKSLFVTNHPSEDALRSLYHDGRYFTNPDFGAPEADGYHGYLDYLGDQPEIESKFESILRACERWIEPGRLMDVGAGPGFLLSAGRSLGWEAEGLEINSWAVAFAQRELGVSIRRGTLAEFDCNQLPYDLITMMDLVEHVPDPDGLLEKARNCLRPGGLLVVLTPDAGSLISRAMGRRWPEVVRVPEHLNLFSVAGLRSSLTRSGFEILDWNWIGKESSLVTLIADITPVQPRLGRWLGELAQLHRWGTRNFEFNPRTKFCAYARAV